VTAVTLCDKCGQPLGAPHEPLDTDCALPHPDHADRYVGLLCRRHYAWIDRTLAEIETLYALLPSVMLPGPSGNERRGTQTGSPAPGNLDAMCVTDRRATVNIPRAKLDKAVADDAFVPDVVGTLRDLVLRVGDERDLDLSGYWGYLTQSVAVLRGQRHWLAAQDWVAEYCDDLAQLHRALAAATRAGLWPQPLGRCPNCDRPLYVTIGVDEITCSKCRASWHGAAFARLRFMLDRKGA
jgi:hypothetical protein